MALDMLLASLLLISSWHIGSSEMIRVNKLAVSNDTVYDCEAHSNITIPESALPGSPQKVHTLDNKTGILISWEPPLENANLVESYTVKYLNETTWKVLNTKPILPSNESSSYLATDLVWGRTYYVRVVANLQNGGCVSSEQVSFTVRLTAIIGVVVSCILLVMVIILLGVYIIRMYKRTRRNRLVTSPLTRRGGRQGQQ